MTRNRLRQHLTLLAGLLLAALFGCSDNSDVPRVDEPPAASHDTPSTTADTNTTGAAKNKSRSTAYDRDAVNYNNIRPVFWSELYPDGGRTLYCSARFNANRGQGFNIEHVLPMSWVTRFLDCGSRKQCRRESPLFNVIESDLHNLYPTRTTINAARSSYRFAIIDGESRQFGDCDFEVDRQRRVAEPTESARGDIARAMLYMELAYQIPLFPAQRELLLDWAEADPVDAEDRRRNRVIGEIQNRTNPYIENPNADAVDATPDR